MPLWQELSRRSVFRVAAAYAIVGWLVTQIVVSIEEPLSLPPWFDTAIIVAVIVGFPVALVLAWAFELTPEGVKRTNAAADDEGAALPSRSPLFGYAIAALLAIAVVFLLIDRYFGDSDPNSEFGDSDPNAAGSVEDSGAVRDARVPVAVGAGGATVALPAAADDAPRIAIAVLPFRNLSADPEQASFADGLSEQLLIGLRQVPELRVTERSASFSFRDSDRTLTEIAAILGVDNVLDGSVRRNGNTVRITPALTRVADGEQLWSETFEFELDDIFAIQDRITEAVATALSVRLGVMERRLPGMTRNIAAYDEFLQANGTRDFNEEATRAAIDHYRRAIALDPTFAVALFALGDTYRGGALVVSEEAEDWGQRAIEAYALARSMIPDSRLAQLNIAEQRIAEGDWIAAGRIYSDLASPAGLREFNLGSGYGAFLLRVGRTREGVEVLEQARSLNPLDPAIAYLLGDAYARTGDFDAALAEIDRGRELSGLSDDLLTGNALFVALGSRDRAEIQRRIADMPDGIDLWDVMGRYLNDPPGGVAEIRRRIEADDTGGPLMVGSLAHWAAYFDAPELALELTEQIPNEVPFLTLMLWSPNMRDVRALPRFHELIERMGLDSYWREQGWSDLCRPVDDGVACD